MKHWLLALALICLGSIAEAGESQIQDILNSSWTVNTVSISSSACVQVDSNSIVLEGRKVIEVQNTNSTEGIRCKHNSTCSQTAGHLINANGGAWALALFARDIDANRLSVYCQAVSTYTAVNVEVTQARSK